MTLAATGEGVVRYIESANRWIYVFMGGLFLVTAIAGFYPTSTGLLDAVEAGTRPPPPLSLHIHAFLMVSWIALFFVQSVLIALGNRQYHIQFGLVSLILIPSIVIATIAVILGLWERMAEVLPSMDETARGRGSSSEVEVIGPFGKRVVVKRHVIVHERDVGRPRGQRP